MEKNTPEWRSFEKLVAIIEKYLCPSGSKVLSPNRIKDKETGELREVDASIEYVVGSTPILITVECRDRISIQDVTWIEQLITKKKSIGAAVTIAVSSTNFTNPAKILAEKNGIEIRTLSDVSEDEIKNWEHQESPHLTFIEWNYTDIKIDIDNNIELSAKIVETINNKIEANNYKAELFEFEDGTKFYTLEEIGMESVKTGIYPNSPDIIGMFRADFIDKEAYILLEGRKIRAYGLEFNIRIKKIEIPIPVLKFSQYSNINVPIVRIAESDFILKEKKFSLKIISKI